MASQEFPDEMYRGSGNMKFLWGSGSLGAVYAIAERLTIEIAGRLLRQAGIDPDSKSNADGLVILDEACGTGVVSARLMETLSDEAKKTLDLTMLDLSPAMVDLVSKRIESNNWQTHNVKVLHADAADTKLPSSSFTHIFLNIGPFIFPDPQVGLAEIYRLLKPGATVGLSTHSKIGWIPDVIAAWKTDPRLPAFPTTEGLAGCFGPDLKWDEPAWIEETLAKAGFVDIKINTTSLHHSEPNATETFKILLPGTVGMIINTMWTQELRDQYGQLAKDVSVRYIHEKYGDGELGWDWSALLITARKPTA